MNIDTTHHITENQTCYKTSLYIHIYKKEYTTLLGNILTTGLCEESLNYEHHDWGWI